jgi:hypothetical protein
MGRKKWKRPESESQRERERRRRRRRRKKLGGRGGRLECGVGRGGEGKGREDRGREWGGDIYSHSDIPGDIADRFQPRRPRTMFFSQIWLQAKYEFEISYSLPKNFGYLLEPCIEIWRFSKLKFARILAIENLTKHT